MAEFPTSGFTVCSTSGTTDFYNNYQSGEFLLIPFDFSNGLVTILMVGSREVIDRPTGTVTVGSRTFTIGSTWHPQDWPSPGNALICSARVGWILFLTGADRIPRADWNAFPPDPDPCTYHAYLRVEVPEGLDCDSLDLGTHGVSFEAPPGLFAYRSTGPGGSSRWTPVNVVPNPPPDPEDGEFDTSLTTATRGLGYSFPPPPPPVRVNVQTAPRPTPPLTAEGLGYSWVEHSTEREDFDTSLTSAARGLGYSAVE